MPTIQDVPQIIDAFGNVRKLGSLTAPAGFVSAFPVFENSFPVWDDATIKSVITHSERTPKRSVFPKTWIQNQGQYGSCNGYAGAAALARASFLRGIFKTVTKLSGAYLYSKINGGRDTGSMLEDGMRAVQQYGCPLESVVTRDMIFPNRQPGNADKEAAKHKGFLCYAARTEQGWKTGLANGFVGIAAVHAGRGYQTVDGEGLNGVDNGPGNHAVCVDDILWMRNDFKYDSPGSWDVSFGVDGRVICGWKSFEQTFGNHTFYLIPTTQDADG